MRDVFMRHRPARGKAFYCLNDVALLLEVGITGRLPARDSDANARSVKILSESDLIKVNIGGVEITKRGQALLDTIMDTPLPA